MLDRSRVSATCTDSSVSGLSHRTAPVELRERIGALGARAGAALRSSSTRYCKTYRVELYARLTSGVEDARDELVDALSMAHDVSRELLLDHLYVHAERTSRGTCAGSPPASTRSFSARPILGQVRGLRGCGPDLGPGLALLFRTAITSGRRARSETAIGANPATASSMALALAEGALGDLREKHILVVGAGRIGLQTLKAAEGRGLASIAVANRTKHRAVEVSERFGAVAHDRRSSRWRSRLPTSPSPRRRRRLPWSAPTSCGRRCRRAAPRSSSSTSPFRRTSSARPARSWALFDVDDLRAGLDGAMAARLREVPKVEAVVESEVEDFGRRYRELEVEPLLSELRKQAEDSRA